jgi:hypothetical protein
MSLDREWAVFQRELPNLLRTPTNQDKFVLIHGDAMFGVWNTYEEAVNAGWDRFGLFEQFLAQRITDHETPLSFSRNVTPCR